MAKSKDVRTRARKAIERARKESPSVAKLLEMVKGITWVVGRPPTAPFNGDSTGSARSYLSSYEFRVRL